MALIGRDRSEDEATDDKRIVSVGAVLMRAGVRAAQYVVERGECHFCSLETRHDDVHDDGCPLHGRSSDDLRKMIAVVEACGNA